MNPAHLGLLVAALLSISLHAPAAADTSAGADAVADVEGQLDRVNDLLESGSDDLAGAMLDTAIETLEAAAKEAPKDAKAQALLARAYGYRGDRAKSDAATTRAAELEPKNAEYQYQLGFVHARARQTDDALAAFKRAAELDPKHAKATLMAGAMLADAGDEEAALRWFVKAAAIDPEYANAHGNVGQINQNRGKHKEALAAFERALEIDPKNWRYRAKLVQLYQALGRIEDRDHQRAVLIDQWREDEIDQPHFCREQFEVAGRRVQVYEHFELEGPRALRYAFIVLKPDGREADFRVTLGSYDITTQIAREQGDVGKDERIFHLDGYYAGGEHRTFGMFKKEPTYEETRGYVVEVLKDQVKPLSSSKPAREPQVNVEAEEPAPAQAPDVEK